MTFLLSITGLAVGSQAPAQAGDADQSGSLTASIYNSSKSPLVYVGGYSQYGWSQVPNDVARQAYSRYGLKGSPTESGGVCIGTWRNQYNGWFTYRGNGADNVPEYITIAVHGVRSHSTALGCPGFAGPNDVYPTIDVFFTSTAPDPAGYRATNGIPPNVVASPTFGYAHNVPYLLDQTISGGVDPTQPHDGPGVGPWSIVSMGDSTISGEAGRWAGNSNASPGYVDALGSTAYWDTVSGEAIAGCHRSKSAEVNIGFDKNNFSGTPVPSANFACSGATVPSWQISCSTCEWKPGLDDTSVVLNDGTTRDSQDRMLRRYATHHNVRAIVVAIGANDYEFGTVVKRCIENRLSSVPVNPNYCSDDADMNARFTPTERDIKGREIFTGLQNIVKAMSDAHYSPDMYNIIVQSYWSAIPNGPDFRTPEAGWERFVQGCPVWDKDASWLNNTVLRTINFSVADAYNKLKGMPGAPNVTMLDMTKALVGHRLCEKGTATVEDNGQRSWKDVDVNKLEWVSQMRVDPASPYLLTEGGHADYWGQLAERNCLRQAYDHGYPRDGRCVPPAPPGRVTLTPGENPGHTIVTEAEPAMDFQAWPTWFPPRKVP